jgi:chromosome partitioning protein
VILAVANTKGGVSKTTLAVNIAIARAGAGRDVLLVDADEQGSAADFTQLRTEQLGSAGYTAMRLRGRAVRSEIEKLKAKFDDVIVDVGGRDNEALRAALVVADTVLIPVLPSSFDVWSFDRMAALVSEARALNPNLVAFAALSAADSQGQDNAAALDAIREVDGIKVLNTIIVRRKAFRNATAQGRGVIDMSPKDAKAIEELAALVKAIAG